MATKIKSGTETVYAESEWHYSLGDAERECIENIDREINDTVRDLESGGKRIIGSTHYSISSEEREENDETEYKCSANSDINWVYNTEKAGSYKSNNKIDEQRFIILEDELLARFIKNYGSSYHSIAIDKIVMLASDVKVGNKISSLPTTANEQIYVSRNCSSEEQAKNIKLSVSTTEGEKFTYDKSITTRNEASFGLTYKIFSAAFKQSWDMKIGSSQETSIIRNKTYQEDFQHKVKPSKELIIKIKREVLNDIYKLEGFILFDGVVKVTFYKKDCQDTGFGRRNCKHKYWDVYLNLSQHLTEEERKFVLDGQATISSSDNTRTTTYYSENAIDCTQEEVVATKNKLLKSSESNEYEILKSASSNLSFTEK